MSDLDANAELREILARARDSALQDPDILDQAARARLSPEDLQRALAEPDVVLWQPCIGEIDELRRIDAERADYRTALRAAGDAVESVAKPLEEPRAPRGKTGLRRPQGEDRAQRAEDELDVPIEEALGRDRRWLVLERRRGEAVDRLGRAVLEKSLLPKLRLAINEQLRSLAEQTRAAQRQRFRAPLVAVDTRGLRGQADAETMVATRAHEELAGLTDPQRAPRVSVGVTGPRGCGKSTLLRLSYDGWTRGIRILVHAPASYVPRDFLLYLYGMVCDQVIARDPDPRVRSRAQSGHPARLRATSLLGLVLVPLVALLVGAFLLAAPVITAGAPSDEELAAIGGGIVVAAAVPLSFQRIQRFVGPFRRASGPAAATRLLSQDFGRWSLPGPGRLLAAVVASGGVLLLAAFDLWSALTLRRAVGAALVVIAATTSVAWPRRRKHAMTPTADLDEARTQLMLAAARRWLLLVAVAAGQVVCAIAGLVLIFVSEGNVAADARVLAGAVLSAGAATALMAGLRCRDVLQVESRLAQAPPSDEYSRRAEADLARIRYQRSVMSGWTSSVKVSAGSWMPFGIDTGLSASTTEAETPLTVPDIIQGIKDLLPVRGPALVAIDELDKLESVEKARDFLNEIKGVLEARDTRFLVSMSEDAIASFERRGLPFRDVFDSAFDDVVRAPYLSAEQGRALLNLRVTELPPPFMALAYCQAGGLPRDILRATERMLAMLARPESVAGPGVPLQEVSRDVVHRDLAGKTEAVNAAIRSIPVEPDVSAILRCIQQLDDCEPPQPRRTRCLLDDDWLAPFDRLDPILVADGASDLADRRALLRLTVELVGYFYYCRTLLELFDVGSDQSVDRLIDVVGQSEGRSLGELARARQSFGVNPFVGWDQVSEFRASHSLARCLLPKPLLAPGRAVPQQAVKAARSPRRARANDATS